MTRTLGQTVSHYVATTFAVVAFVTAAFAIYLVDRESQQRAYTNCTRANETAGIVLELVNEGIGPSDDPEADAFVDLARAKLAPRPCPSKP